MLHLNVRSIIQNFESLKELLTTINFEFKEICLTETCCTIQEKNFKLENYTLINRVTKHGRGGDICVFIHNSLIFKLRSDLGTNSNDIESLAIEIINKAKMLPLVYSIDNQPAILNNIS